MFGMDERMTSTTSQLEPLHLAARQFTSAGNVKLPGSVSSSFVGDLPNYKCTVQSDALLAGIAQELEDRPELPGVLVMQGAECIGVLSRAKCFEWLGRPYGVEVFLHRPVMTLLSNINTRQEPIPARMFISQAVKLALSRPAALRYEPVLIQQDDQDLRLLDLHVLLLAQSELLSNSNRLVRQQIEMGQTLSRNLNPDELLEMILESAVRIIPSDRAGVLLKQDTGLHFAASRGYARGLDLNRLYGNLPRSEIYQQIYLTQQLVYLEDISQRADWQWLDPLAATHSWLAVPLVYADQLIGLVLLTRDTPHAYHEQDLMLAQTFSGQASVALENARLYAKINSFNRDLENVVRERTEALQIVYNRLEQINRTKTEFLHIVSHELRTPLSLINGYGNMLLADPRNQHDAETWRILQELQMNTRRLTETMNTILDVARQTSETD